MPVVKCVLAVKDTKPLQASVELAFNSPAMIQPGERIESAIEAAKGAKESNLLPPGFGDGDDTMTASDENLAEGVKQVAHALVQMDNAP
jgi:hypothetical protein